jgi:hypothetical protein
MKAVLEERGLPVAGLLKHCKPCNGAALKDPKRYERDNCCLTRMMAAQPDFAAERGRIEKYLREKTPHMCLFLPKFHPELNRTLTHSMRPGLPLEADITG